MIITTTEIIKRFLVIANKGNKTLGFVPTMGSLHEGHLFLIRRAKKENDLVVVSIFVNPTQFGPNEDFNNYPRNVMRDTNLAYEAGADVIFNPTAREMYHDGSSTWVNVDGDMTAILCGASRPDHFRGVATVVNMLLNIVEPDKAYFGQKDAQQAAVLKKMVEDLHMDVELVICPIVREEDGLALSSRNIYLNDEERSQAVILNEALQLAQDNYMTGETNPDTLIQLIKDKISTMPLAMIEYVNIYAYPSLAQIETIDQKAIAAVAVKFGKTRLIDNVIFKKRK